MIHRGDIGLEFEHELPFSRNLHRVNVSSSATDALFEQGTLGKLFKDPLARGWDYTCPERHLWHTWGI